ncbi:MAG: DUF2807 domain-containing protein [Bacteroidota bacterium]
MKSSQELDQLLVHARELAPELSLAQVQGYINNLPPVPPQPPWTDFITLKIKWIMFSTVLLTTLLSSLLLWNTPTVATMAAQSEPNPAAVASPVLAETIEMEAVLAKPSITSAPDQIGMDLTDSAKEQSPPIVQPAPAAVEQSDDDVSAQPASAQKTMGQQLANQQEHIPTITQGPLTPLRQADTPKDIDIKLTPAQPELDAGRTTSKLPEARSNTPISQLTDASLPSAIAIDFGEGDTTHLGSFEHLTVKGKVRVYLQKGIENMLVIKKRVGAKQSTSVKETLTNGKHEVALNLRSTDSRPFEVLVYTTNLQTLQLNEKSEAYALNELGQVEVIDGAILPYSAENLSATSSCSSSGGSVRPYRWGRCAENVVATTTTLADFNEVVVKGRVRVVLRKGSENKAKLLTEMNRGNDISMEVNNGVLTIKPKASASKFICYDIQLTSISPEQIKIGSKSAVYFDNDLGKFSFKGTFCSTKNFNDWVED